MLKAPAYTTTSNFGKSWAKAADYLEANKPEQERTQQKSKLLVDMTNDELQIEWRHWNSVIAEATGLGAPLATANEFRRDCERELRRRGLQPKQREG